MGLDNPSIGDVAVSQASKDQQERLEEDKEDVNERYTKAREDEDNQREHQDSCQGTKVTLLK